MGQPILSKFSSFPSTLSASVCWSIKALPHGGALVVPLVKSWRFLFRKRVGRTWSLKNQKHPLLSFQWCYGAGGGDVLFCVFSPSSLFHSPAGALDLGSCSCSCQDPKVKTWWKLPDPEQSEADLKIILILSVTVPPLPIHSRCHPLLKWISGEFLAHSACGPIACSLALTNLK